MKSLVPILLLLMSTMIHHAGLASSNDIHSVNFKNNFAYRPSCLRFAETPAEVEAWQLSNTGESVIVTNGVFKSNNPDDATYFMVSKIAYGRLNGTSNEIAIVVTVCNTGGTGDFSDGFIYGLVNNKSKVLATINGGDRAFGGIHSATVDHGLLRVERLGTSGGACCPERLEIRNYKLQNGKLTEVGLPRRTKYEGGLAE